VDFFCFENAFDATPGGERAPACAILKMNYQKEGWRIVLFFFPREEGGNIGERDDNEQKRKKHRKKEGTKAPLL
jgi:hypothetical protein